ncbi:MAG TPA: thiamine phosphate synthase [Acidobacteriota bacterium]|nr:thiamine phosphate synthase [Acidobacteriota bacterium]
MQRHFLDPLYPLTHVPNLPGASHLTLAECFLRGGCRFFQVRAKEASDRELHRQLLSIAQLCRDHNARFVVNDRVDHALFASASGVHLGQDDLPVAAARQLLGGEAIIGLSTHSEEQFLQALDQDIDYVALGPIFESGTKPGQNKPVGCRLLARLAAMTTLPVVAIGGITLKNVSEVWKAGATSAAVISDIVNSPSPAQRVMQYLELADRIKRERAD